MFIRMILGLEKLNLLQYPVKGIVKVNDDPNKKLGRVKCLIENILEDTDNLIWCYPKNPYGLGGANDSSWFSVPEVDSELIIEFPFKNIYLFFLLKTTWI